ncbi:MAG: tetratricopeptide repeat protein, partial [Verrucomicrobiota bacterium]
TPEIKLTEKQFHREMAAKLFNETWNLIDKKERTPEETDRMIHSAHASRLHWGYVGTAENLAVGEWQIARVYSVLGRAEAAMHHAQRAVEIAEKNQFKGFHLGSAYEGLARALWVSGDRSSAREYLAKARQIAEKLTDEEDRKVLLEDIESVGK